MIMKDYMEENSFNLDTIYYTEEELNLFKYWHDEKLKEIKQWMRENNCPIYIDYGTAALRGGLPITYVAKPEDLYTEEELALQKFKNYKPLVEPLVHIKN